MGPSIPFKPSGRGSGQQLPAPVRVQMEAAFASDFSQVRIHQGPNASLLGARAYTSGNDIHFAPGAYDPYSRDGQQLLSHELTHVVQQGKPGSIQP